MLNFLYSPTLMSIESVTPSSHPILCHPFLLSASIFPSIRVFSDESTLHIRWPKYWSFSFSIIPSKEIQGLISFRTAWLDLLAVQGTLKSLLQHHSLKAPILQCSALFMVQLSDQGTESVRRGRHRGYCVSVTAGTGGKATQGDFGFQVLESRDILAERAHVEASCSTLFFCTPVFCAHMSKTELIGGNFWTMESLQAPQPTVTPGRTRNTVTHPVLLGQFTEATPDLAGPRRTHS